MRLVDSAKEEPLQWRHVLGFIDDDVLDEAKFGRLGYFPLNECHQRRVRPKRKGVLVRWQAI